jgi:hypothetical protein
MNYQNENDSVEVFAGNAWDTGMVKSLLEDNEIDAFLIGDNLSSVAPWISSPGGVGAISVVVAAKDYERALAIVDAFRKTQL